MDANMRDNLIVPISPPATLRGALNRRWRWILGVALAGSVVGAIAALSLPQRYLAQVSLRLVPDKTISLQSEHRIPDDSQASRPQYIVLRSPRLLTLVATRLRLDQRWSMTIPQAVERVQQELATSSWLDGSLTRLRVMDPDPQLAANIANAVADAYANRAEWQSALDQLGSTARLQSQQLRAAQENVVRIRQRTGLANQQIAVSAPAIISARQTLSAAQAQAIDAQLYLRTLESARNDPVLVMLYASPGDSLAQHLAARLTDAQAGLADARQRYGPEHPRLAAAVSRYETDLAAANLEVERILAKAKALCASADSRVAAAREQLDQARQEGGEPAEQSPELAGALQQEQIQLDLQKVLNERIQKSSMELQLAGPAAQIVAAATPPTRITYLPLYRYLLSGLSIGLAAGLVVGFVRDRSDHTLHDARQALEQFRLPLLGATRRVNSSSGAAEASRDSEAFRMVRNSIDFIHHSLHCLCINGAADDDGAAVVVAGLARAWTEHGARVLVIDASQGRSSLDCLLGVNNSPGLADHLWASVPLDQVVVKSAIPNLSVLPAGKPAPSASTRTMPLAPDQIDSVLRWARSRADLVLLHAGPVLHASDAAVVARVAGAAALVMRPGQTCLSDAQRALQILGGCGAQMLGIILYGCSAADVGPWLVPQDSPRQTTAAAGDVESGQASRARHAA